MKFSLTNALINHIVELYTISLALEVKARYFHEEPPPLSDMDWEDEV